MARQFGEKGFFKKILFCLTCLAVEYIELLAKLSVMYIEPLARLAVVYIES